MDNPHAPFPDNRLRVDYFVRTPEMNKLLKLQEATYEDEEQQPTETLDAIQEAEDDDETPKNNGTGEIQNPEAHGGLDLNEEVLSIPSNCPHCNAVCQANFKTIKIPFFKDVIIMATVCDQKNCGYRSNEVKSGTGFSDKGQKIVLTLNNEKNLPSTDLKIDLARDILKSETAGIAIPEIDFEIGRGAIEGKFTTVEGLLGDIQRVVKNNPFTTGDSALAHAAASGDKTKKQSNLEIFNQKIEDILSGEMKNVRLVLDDPAGNSYIQNVNAPDDDPQLEIIDYERTFEQNEDLGLNQMMTEGYEEEEK